MIIRKVDPFASSAVFKILFLLSLAIALLGTIGIVVFLVRRKFYPEEFLVHQLGISLRQAFLATVLVITSLLLAHRGILRWWNLLILLVTLTLAEFIFFSLQRKPRVIANREYTRIHE